MYRKQRYLLDHCPVSSYAELLYPSLSRIPYLFVFTNRIYVSCNHVDCIEGTLIGVQTGHGLANSPKRHSHHPTDLFMAACRQLGSDFRSLYWAHLPIRSSLLRGYLRRMAFPAPSAPPRRDMVCLDLDISYLPRRTSISSADADILRSKSEQEENARYLQEPYDWGSVRDYVDPYIIWSHCWDLVDSPTRLLRRPCKCWWYTQRRSQTCCSCTHRPFV